MAVFVGDDHGRAHRPCQAQAHQPQELQLSGMSLPNTRHSQLIQKTQDFLVPSYKTAGPMNIPSNHPKPQGVEKAGEQSLEGEEDQGIQSGGLSLRRRMSLTINFWNMINE